ncbi:MULTISPECIES: hypothetical protein [Brevibacillus]|uniref:hypothetical protein n=1 Tax=Brevibacillus TaxID=55080 RepID=UPI000D103CE5|nr:MULTISPECIES: hypothetical protein [Brevibacillus]MED1946760.1 hypothetical protein [Brevibacillus formosus]MED1997018.1 hypothetical protein [Brevibacillus formosus]MED2084935.1 hypothetical protein [Brevibacillus formosus]PSK20250.1 hypothetical protein C7R94_05175 [Brevibacillus sp. NRRL NRS-603]
MSYVTFDCTQFISFDSDNEADVAVSLKEFEVANQFKVLPKDEILPNKIAHLRHFLHSSVFEMVNQEFIGEFDEWLEREEVPVDILSFSRNIQLFVQNKHVQNATVILVRYAHDEKNEDRIFVGEFHKEHILEGLYHASCFENAGNIVVLKMKSNDGS